MPQTIETTVYAFNELDETAKQKAREWYLESALNYDWWEYIYEDAIAIGKILGIEIERIYFSGFGSQGDGACFDGTFAYRKNMLRELAEYAPNDEELREIATNIYNTQRQNFYRLSETMHRHFTGAEKGFWEARA